MLFKHAIVFSNIYNVVVFRGEKKNAFKKANAIQTNTRNSKCNGDKIYRDFLAKQSAKQSFN